MENTTNIIDDDERIVDEGSTPDETVNMKDRIVDDEAPVEQEDHRSITEKWVDSIENIIIGYRDLITMKAVEHVSKGIASSVVGILMLSVFVLVLVFLGIGSAWWIGESMDNMKAGFFIVGGFFTLLLIVMVSAFGNLFAPIIRNFIINKFYETHNEDEDN